MSGTIEEVVNSLSSKVSQLEAKLEAQNNEMTRLSSLVQNLLYQLDTKVEKDKEVSQLNTMLLPKPENNQSRALSLETKESNTKNRRNFLRKLARVSLLTLGVSSIGIVTTQKEAVARILVNPTAYPIQFGAITTPPGTTISGQLQDTAVRIGLAACGDPTMDYSKLPLFDTGVYAQGAGYGLYAVTNKSAASAGYFRNTAPLGVGQGLAITAISDNGTAISGVGNNAAFGVMGDANGSGNGVHGSSFSGAGVSGSSSNGAGLTGSSDSGIPLRLTPSSSVPISGTRGKGDFYVDALGRVYVWARNDGNSADVWRQIQFVPA